MVGRLDPATLTVTARVSLPGAPRFGQLTAARGRVLLAVAGVHPYLVVLRERDLARLLLFPSQASPASTQMSPPSTTRLMSACSAVGSWRST